MYTPEFMLVSASSCGSTTNIGAAMVRSAAGGQEVSGEQSREAPLLKIEPDQDRVHETHASQTEAEKLQTRSTAQSSKTRGAGGGASARCPAHTDTPRFTGQPRSPVCIQEPPGTPQQPMGSHLWEERRCA